jgi:peptide/nickel transport system permease protein
LLATIPVVILTSIIVFMLIRLLPGDPILVIVGQAHVDVPEETINELRRVHGLDRSIIVQYATWIGQVVSGDLGRSIQSRQPVSEMLLPRILPTIQIGLSAWLLALVIGVPIGIATATDPNSWKDWLGIVGALVGAAMPYFLVGGLLIYFVALEWRLLPASGYVSPFENPLASLRTTILPSVTLALGLAAVVTRQTRSSFADVFQHAYIKTARAKGLHEVNVVMGHAFKNAMLPVVTILGIQLGTVFSGAIITETIFAVPGIGRMLVDAILGRDYPVVQAVVLFISLMVVLANLAVDIAYGILDPRTRRA